MSQVNYKSTRLLVEATNKAMDAVRKAAMGNIALPWDHLNELRDLVAELAKKADRTALEDVPGLPPADYVATMKPLVATFHRQLMVVDKLAPCLCEDLQSAACVLILVGDGRTVVRAAHDPSRPEMALAVEAIIDSLDSGTKQIVVDAAAVKQRLYDAVAEQSLGEGGEVDDLAVIPKSGALDATTEAEAEAATAIEWCPESFEGIDRQAKESYVIPAGPPFTFDMLEEGVELMLRRERERVKRSEAPSYGPEMGDEDGGDET